MSEYGSGGGGSKRPQSSHDRSKDPRSEKRTKYPDLLNKSDTMSGYHPLLSGMGALGTSAESRYPQISSTGRSAAAVGGEPSNSTAGQASSTLTDPDYEHLLRLGLERLGNPDQEVDSLRGPGKLRLRTRDCMTLAKTANGTSLHNRKSHTEVIVGDLGAHHTWHPWLTFARANNLQLLTCKERSCPGFHVPSLGGGPDETQGGSEGGGVSRVVTDDELFEAEFGPEGSSDHVKDGFLNFGSSVGYSRLKSIGVASRAVKTARKGWSNLITQRVIQVVERVKAESIHDS